MNKTEYFKTMSTDDRAALTALHAEEVAAGRERSKLQILDEVMTDDEKASPAPING